MAFSPKVWQDTPSTATPVSAAGLIDLETRLSNYTDSRALTVGTGITNTSGTISVTYGTGSGTAAQGNDSRFTKVYRSSHTFAVGGVIATAIGSSDLTNYIPPFFVSLGSSETSQKIVKCTYIIGTGTSATVKLQKNGSDLTGFTAISVTTSASTTSPTAQSVAEGDSIALVVTAISGTPANLSFTIFIEHTVT